MATKQTLTFPAHYLGLKILQASGVAELQFLVSENGPLRVTIPLHDLVRLQRESQRKRAEEKYQAFRESRKS